MTNTYDVINELYTEDEGWNTLLERKYAEQFLRTEAFRGASDDELLDIWQQVMYLLIYCGNTSYKIGDMTGEDFIYCISWCQRNIGDFELNYDSVERFLSVVDRLLSFLKQKRAISSDTAAEKCRLKLLGPNKKLLLFQEDCSLPEEYEKYRTNREPDLETKVFMQMGQKITDLFELMQGYFSTPKFALDRKYACYTFFGTETAPELLDERTELISSFWEYFLFDYRLRDTNERPIEHFYKYYKKHPNPKYARSNKALTELLESMLKIRMMIFTIEGEDIDGWFQCKDFFTGSISELSLPVDDTVDTSDFVCIAHVFEDGNLITEYMRSVIISPIMQKALKSRFSRLLRGYRIAHPKADWEQFCNDNVALVMHMVAIAGAPEMKSKALDWSADIQDYKPAAVCKNMPVNQFLMQFGKLLHFSWQDRQNLIQMWSDFHELCPVSCFSDEEFMIWALAVMENYMKITRTFLLDVAAYAEKINIVERCIRERESIIHEKLHLIPYDPRYISEDALINMVFS